MKKQSIIIQLVVVLAILAIANLISNQLYFRFDFTEGQRFTLSPATNDILNDLDDVVTITAYFSKDLPAQLLNNRKDFEDFLIEYEKRSGGNVVYEFINPNENEAKETEVQQKGIGPVMINVTENDRVQQMRAYMGATLQLGDKTEIIPLVQPGAALEYELTTAIKKLSVSDKPKIGWLQGHGEATMSSAPQLIQQLNDLYEVEEHTLNGSNQILNTYQALVMVAPSDTIPAEHLAELDNFVKQGGKLLITYTNVIGDLQQGFLTPGNDIGLVEWLERNGILMGKDFVIDAQCAPVTVTQQQGFFRINSQIEFPYFPRISNFGDHPMTKGLDEAIFAFASSVVPVNQDSSIQASRILFTSSNSGLVSPPAYLDIQKKWQESDFNMGVQSLGVAMEGLGNGLGKIVVVGNGNFFINGEGQQARQIAPDQINLATNAVDWLVDDTGLIALRTKGITSRPLKSIEDGTKNLLKYVNVFAPIFIILVYALIRRFRNQKKRQL